MYWGLCMGVPCDRAERMDSMKEPRKTSGTTWVIPTDAIQMFRATCMDNGKFRMANGEEPKFDPATAAYATPDMVGNLCATHNITMFGGDVASRARFMAVAKKHAWKEIMDLEGLKAHKYHGRTMPSVETIIAAYATLVEIEA